jgi:hypothetical protein
MRLFVRNLSVPAEAFLVTVVCFGLQFVNATSAIISQLNHSPIRGFLPGQVGTTTRNFHFGPVFIARMVIVELLSLALAFWIWKARGTPYSTWGWQISWKGTGLGCLLIGLVVVATALLGAALNALHPEPAVRVVGTTLPFALLGAVVNPVFEETIECGYFLHVLRSLGMWPAILPSALFVGLLHSYQGPNGVVDIVLIRVVFGLAYWRWRQLWPLFFAHCFFDLLAFLSQPGGY